MKNHCLTASPGTFAASANFLDGSDAFPVALGTVVDLSELLVHLYKPLKSLNKTKRRVAESQRTAALKNQLALSIPKECRGECKNGASTMLYMNGAKV